MLEVIINRYEVNCTTKIEFTLNITPKRKQT